MNSKINHMRNHDAPGPEFVALCGHRSDNSSDFGETSPDTTCKSCNAIMRAKASALRMKAIEGAQSKVHDALQAKLVEAFKASSIPCAGSPPMLNASVWPATCKGGEQRCHECVLCEWERDAERWSSVAPYNRVMRLQRPAGAARWPSLAAALVALVEWERHGRVAPSASAGILACIERGYMDGGSNKSGDPLLNRGGELVRVRMALEQACPVDAHSQLTQAQCITVVMARTPGVLLIEEPYDQISVWCGVSAGSLQALVKNARRTLTVELSARNLIPRPHPEAGLAESIESVLCGMERKVANG